jgi:NAD+-dependent protein deacetylase sirtuin 5
LQNILSGFGEIMKSMPKAEEQETQVTMPEVSDITSTAEFIAKKTEIAILTGSGISAASGIPTFRGEGGFWVTQGKFIEVV